jgi:predicted HAD superfamily Cof-like phosphohydrolase
MGLGSRTPTSNDREPAVDDVARKLAGANKDYVVMTEEATLRALQDLHHLREQVTDLQRKCTAQEIELRGLRTKRSNLSSQVEAFMHAFNQPARSTPGLPSNDKWIRLRAELVLEEAFELAMAVFVEDPRLHDLHERTIGFVRSSWIDVDLVKVADALADIDYVVEGMRLTFGIDGGPVANAVHCANMAKVGGPIDPVTGKKLKPPDWEAPDIKGVLVAQGWKNVLPEF